MKITRANNFTKKKEFYISEITPIGEKNIDRNFKNIYRSESEKLFSIHLNDAEELRI